MLIVLGIVLISICFRIDRRSPAHLFPAACCRFSDPSTLGHLDPGADVRTEAAAPLYMAYSSRSAMAPRFSSPDNLGHHRVAWSLSAIYISRFGRGSAGPMLILGPALLTLGLAALMFWNFMPLYVSAFALIALGTGFGLSYTFFTEYVIGLSPQGERDVTAGAIPTLENTCAAIGAALAGLLGNLAGFGASGAADIPEAVPVTVFGVSAALSLLALAAAVRFRRLVIAAGR